MSSDQSQVTVSYRPHPSCQIPILGEILENRFGVRRDGTFVEVGAFDGETCSNTSFLADFGWRGLYMEPVPSYAEACRKRHYTNAKVSVVQSAVGATEQPITLMIGHVLTTGDAAMANAYRQISWARGLQSNQHIVVPQLRLETILQKERIPRGFEVLVIDVEGGEESVFNSFDLADWRPKMLIVELVDEHPDF